MLKQVAKPLSEADGRKAKAEGRDTNAAEELLAVFERTQKAFERDLAAHKADIPTAATFVRYWTRADIDERDLTPPGGMRKKVGPPLSRSAPIAQA